MHIVILTAGKNDTLSIQHLHHHPAGTQGPERAPSRCVNLLVLDARDMSPECLNSATRKVVEIRQQNGLGHGVLLCAKPTLPLLVASIRCGLRDVITQYIDAVHLRQVLRSAVPGLTRREYRDTVSFLRTFNAFSTGEGDATTLARRAEELARRAEALAEQEKELALEKDRIARAEQDLRERTRRLDRQIARMQDDADVAPGAPALGSPELETMSKRLDKRAAELDVQEKLLNEMQALLLSSPQAVPLQKHLSTANNPAGLIG
jgi:DNA repair exonuclease SbcCD ATPase subunit